MVVPVWKATVVAMEREQFLPGERVEQHIVTPGEPEVFVVSVPPLANPEGETT